MESFAGDAEGSADDLTGGEALENLDNVQKACKSSVSVHVYLSLL